jgi:N-acetylglucosamine-6-sulfatase
MNIMGLPRLLSIPLLVAVIATLVSLNGTRLWPLLERAQRPGLSAAAGLAVGDRRPNFVMLMTDDQTVTDMGVMRKARRLIGAAGVSFTRSFVSYPLCCPSRASYFTGQYAHNHGVLYNKGPHGGYHAFTHPETSFPAVLQRAGYTTIHIGKYLNGFGSRTLRAPAGWNDFRGAVDPTTYNYYGFRLDENGKLRTYLPTERNYRTDVYGRMASGIIRRLARSHRPIFLNVAFLAPHSAGSQEEALGPTPAAVMRNMLDNRLAVPPRRYRGRLRDLPLPHPASFNRLGVGKRPAFMRRGPWRSFFRHFTAADIRDITRRYHARLESLLAVDDAVQKIVTTLRETGLLKNTVIMFTSDNGFFNGEHRIRAGKYFVYDPATRVPLLMRGPGIAKGVTRSDMVANIDLAPTILALAHTKPLRTMDGRSLVPLLGSGSPGIRWRRDLLLETGPNTEYPATYYAIRTNRYLYVEYNTGDRELYDLGTDPDELNNRVDDPAYASIRAQLAHRLARLETCRGVSCQ